MLQGYYRVSGKGEGIPLEYAVTVETDRLAEFLDNARKLIPAEAVAGYISMQALSATATDKASFNVVVAIVFLFIAVLLRVFGSRPAEATGFDKTQIVTVLTCFVAYIALVYASGGQIWFHEPFADQALYGQLLSAAIGILAPTVLPRFMK